MVLCVPFVLLCVYQKLQELQSSLKAKFQFMDSSDVPVRANRIFFRLPDGQRLQYCFHENVAVKVVNK